MARQVFRQEFMVKALRLVWRRAACRGVPHRSRVDPKMLGRRPLAQSPSPNRIPPSNTKLISRRHGERTRGARFCRAARSTRRAIMFLLLMRSRWRTGSTTKLMT
jgi:hypothetical protein